MPEHMPCPRQSPTLDATHPSHPCLPPRATPCIRSPQPSSSHPARLLAPPHPRASSRLLAPPRASSRLHVLPRGASLQITPGFSSMRQSRSLPSSLPPLSSRLPSAEKVTVQIPRWPVVTFSSRVPRRTSKIESSVAVAPMSRLARGERATWLYGSALARELCGVGQGGDSGVRYSQPALTASPHSQPSQPTGTRGAFGWLRLRG